MRAKYAIASIHRQSRRTLPLIRPCGGTFSPKGRRLWDYFLLILAFAGS